MVTYDAIVVGGSVAGSTTARELGRLGLRVALLEKARFPRPKACGEGLLPQGVEALQAMGVDPGGVPVRGLRFVSPSGISAQADFPSGEGRVVRRDRFDAHLFRAAAATPNVDAFEETVYDPERWKGHWIVGADGLRSGFHHRPEFAATPPRLRRLGLSTHVRGLDVDPERVEVLLHAAGEIYLAPSGEGEALVSCLYRQDRLAPGSSNEERVHSTLDAVQALRGRVGKLTFTTPCLGVAPLGLSVASVVSGNTLLVGDAAGAPDPITGEGMSLAILSARAAAEAIGSGNPDPYAPERRRLAAGSDWLGRWMLRATRHPRLADRVVASLDRRPDLFAKLLEISSGLRPEVDLTLIERASLVV